MVHHVDSFGAVSRLIMVCVVFMINSCFFLIEKGGETPFQIDALISGKEREASDVFFFMIFLNCLQFKRILVPKRFFRGTILLLFISHHMERSTRQGPERNILTTAIKMSPSV